MIFNEGKKGKTPLREQPLNYWEEYSYLLALPQGGYVHLSDEMLDRVAAIEGVTMMDQQMPDDEQPGKIVVQYEGEQYEVQFYAGGFSLPEMLNHQGYYFTDEEMEAIKEASSALTVFMKFGTDSKRSYHLQLKLVVAMMPRLLAIMDESAERLVSGHWATLAAESSIVPGPNSLFTVQAVSDESGEVWLHTHGLNRCGLYELEIVGSDSENCNNHYSVISTLASHLLDDENNPLTPRSGAYIGMLNDGRPLVATYVPWVESVTEYDKPKLGGVDCRQDGHNGHTALVFLYLSEKDEKRGKLSKVSVYNKAFGENPIFFISTQETQRMSALARERFGLVRYMSKKSCDIILKIGLRTDEGNTADDYEHIWFKLLEVENDRFRAQLLQEPYRVSGMHEGDEGWYTIDDVTDWVIYLEDFSVMPDTAYLLV